MFGPKSCKKLQTFERTKTDWSTHLCLKAEPAVPSSNISGPHQATKFDVGPTISENAKILNFLLNLLQIVWLTLNPISDSEQTKFSTCEGFHSNSIISFYIEVTFSNQY